MPRNIEEPTVDAEGREHHPAFGKITVNRSQVTPGASLFDSDIRHREVVVLRVHTADRTRNLNSDWIHGDKQLIEIEMSLAQWASVVSSFGNGEGTPVTLTWRTDRWYDTDDARDPRVPNLPFAPRMATQVAETVGTAERMYDNVRAALEAYKAHKTVGNLRDLERAIDHVGSNVKFATTRLTEHVEDTVTRAKADVEAMVINRARALGIEPGDLGEPLELES